MIITYFKLFWFVFWLTRNETLLVKSVQSMWCFQHIHLSVPGSFLLLLLGVKVNLFQILHVVALRGNNINVLMVYAKLFKCATDKILKYNHSVSRGQTEAIWYCFNKFSFTSLFWKVSEDSVCDIHQARNESFHS